MIFDNLTYAAMALFILISAFLIGTRNRPPKKGDNPCTDCTEKQNDQ